MKFQQLQNFFGFSSNKLTWNDLRCTRIPGVRKIIKYGIEKKIARSRVWLVICMWFLSVTTFNLMYAVHLFLTQKISIVKSYEWKDLNFPRIMMCIPTSYSFSRLKNESHLIPDVLSRLDSKDLYRDLLSRNEHNLSSTHLARLLELNLNQTLISCKFQTEPCNFSYISLFNHSAHACFTLETFPGFSTNSTGRDAGLELFINLNAFDGMDERPGMAGGLKVIFMNPAYMSMPHPHDVVYTESGRLNSVSLVAHKRISISNCITSKRFHPHETMEMNRDQIKYYQKLPCLLQNYYATKTSSKLRSSVAFQNLPGTNLKLLQNSVPTANQLKSIYVDTIRQRDFELANTLFKLTQKLVESLTRWKKPGCSRVRNSVNVDVAVTYIRGRSEGLKLYSEELLLVLKDAFAQGVSEFLKNAKGIKEASFARALTLNFTRGSRLYKLVEGATHKYEIALNAGRTIYSATLKMVEMLGGVDVFQESTQIVKTGAKSYFYAYQNASLQMHNLLNCFHKNKAFVIKNVPFVHTDPVICTDATNTSIDYGICPDEVSCSGFDNNYVDKYNMRSAFMRDTTPAPTKNIAAYVFSACFGYLLKDIMNAFSVEVREIYIPVFEKFRLDEIAMAQWNDDKIFDAHDIECRSFQACWRLIANVATNNNYSALGSEWKKHFNLEMFAKSLTTKLGSMALGLLQSCEYYRKQTSVQLGRYLQEYDQSVIEPFEEILAKLVSFRHVLPLIREYRPLQLLHRGVHNSLMHQLTGHLTDYFKTSNLSSLAYFMNRRGKIMVGEVRIYTEHVQTFITYNKRLFSSIFLMSRHLDMQIRKEPNPFLRILKQNVTASVLSLNLSYALNIISNVKLCSRTIIRSLNNDGVNILKALNNWLGNTQPLLTRTKQYLMDETLDKHFVKNNFVQLELYFEDMAEGIEEEQYTMTKKMLVSKLGALGRFYMGLKFFNVAEFLGPIVLFLFYRVLLKILVQ